VCVCVCLCVYGFWVNYVLVFKYNFCIQKYMHIFTSIFEYAILIFVRKTFNFRRPKKWCGLDFGYRIEGVLVDIECGIECVLMDMEFNFRWPKKWCGLDFGYRFYQNSALRLPKVNLNLKQCFEDRKLCTECVLVGIEWISGIDSIRTVLQNSVLCLPKVNINLNQCSNPNLNLNSKAVLYAIRTVFCICQR